MAASSKSPASRAKAPLPVFTCRKSVSVARSTRWRSDREAAGSTLASTRTVHVAKGADHQRAGKHVVQGALAPVDQHEEQDQKPGPIGGQIKQHGMRQRLQEDRPLPGP